MIKGGHIVGAEGVPFNGSEERALKVEVGVKDMSLETLVPFNGSEERALKV